MRSGRIALGAFMLLVGLSVPSASAATTHECARCPTTASGGEGMITVAHGTSDHVPGRGPATQGRDLSGTPHDYSYVNERSAPTCGGNGLGEDGILCQFAVTSCPALDQVRFWIWHQTVSVAVGPPQVTTTGDWHQEPGSFCLGTDDPGVPSIVRTLVAGQSAFEQRIRALAAPTASSTPGPRTLVHYPTTFTATGADPFAFAVSVAGATVHLHAVPTAFHWTFGDGSSTDTTDPSAHHAYPDKGARLVTVDVTWGGWFTVDGGQEPYAIAPPAHATGRPSVLTVLEARAENLA